MFGKEFRQKLPGHIATALVITVTMLWTYWGFGEMYYEGWWGEWYNRIVYLSPGGACLALTLVVLKWPRQGGWLLVLVGVAFTVWWWGPAALHGELTLRRVLSQFPISGMLVIIGALFLLEARYRQRRCAEGWTSPENWFRRNLYCLLAIGLPLLVAVGVSAYNLPLVLTRIDDGGRGERLIEGNEVALVWAPKGPGWNWKQPWGGYPSWDAMALYGVPPAGLGDKEGYGWQEGVHAAAVDMAETGLCRYLSEDGLMLMTAPQDIWRMPTTDEVVRSLVKHGQNAGCAWDGEDDSRADCAIVPDKETPLWEPDQPPVYYWSTDEYDDRRAYYVSFNGRIAYQPKDWGNPRHGYRCVREP
jgi:hypothetical protein